MGSIQQGLGLIELGSSTFTTGSAAGDAGTDFLGQIVGAFNSVFGAFLEAVGSSDA